MILSDGTRGYISSQFVVWEKPYDPPKKTTTTKTYIYVSKSGYPKSGWAGNRLKQTQRLNLKSSPKSSGNTVRSVPYATEGVVRGRTSNGYYVSGGNGYQVVYGIESHIIFSKPTKNTTLLSSNDALIVKTSNDKSSTGCCGSGSSKDDIPDKIPNGTTTKTEDPVDVEDAPDDTAQTPSEEIVEITGTRVGWVYREDGKVINVYSDSKLKDKLIDYGLPSGTEVYVYDGLIGSSYAIVWGNGEKAYVYKERIVFERPNIQTYCDPSFPVKFTSPKGTISCFLEVAKSQNDYHETDDGNTVYTQWFKKPVGTEWCHMFVSWCADQAGILNTRVPYTASCTQGMKYFQQKGLYHEMADLRNGTDKYQVKPGDIVYFLWDGSYNGKSTKADHVGIVVSIDLKSNTLKVAEGNASKSVIYGKSRDIALLENKVIGFGEI